MAEQNLVETTRNYYDSTDADNFYHTIWGGEDIHVGIYNHGTEEILAASHRTVKTMIEMLPALREGMHLLDMGAGYGGAARHIASTYPVHIDCLNLSETENERNREKTRAAGLDKNIAVMGGNFEAMPFDDHSYDVVWSEDSFLHSDQKAALFAEAERVLKPGGHFIFTDPMQADDCPTDVLAPILKRIHLREMGSVKKYRELAAKNNLTEVEIKEMPEQLTHHYASVLKQLEAHEDKLKEVCSEEYLSNMKQGLNHWVNGGKKGYLNWGILHFKK